MTSKGPRENSLLEEISLWLDLVRPLLWALVAGVAIGVLVDSATTAGIAAGTIVMGILVWRGYIRPHL
jgi:hypothetical protein